MSSSPKAEAYAEVHGRISCLIGSETDIVSAMSTMVCELYHAFDPFHWVGFYRVTTPGILKVGPYQGTHGCLTIPFSQGVCGRCAREATSQIVDDVTQLPYHIACSTSTLSEIVVPVLDLQSRVRAVLDIDSDEPAAFNAEDARNLERLCLLLGPIFPPLDQPFPT